MNRKGMISIVVGTVVLLSAVIGGLVMAGVPFSSTKPKINTEKVRKGFELLAYKNISLVGIRNIANSDENCSQTPEQV